MSAAVPVVSTGWIDPEWTIATVLAASGEEPPVRSLFADSVRYRVGPSELQAR